MSVLSFSRSVSVPDDFGITFKTVDQCKQCIDVIMDEIVPLVLKDRGLHDQASKVTSLSGGFRARLLKLYSVLDQVIQLLDIDRLESSDLSEATADMNMAAFNCLSDACYVLMMYNDARSQTSPEDVGYYLNFAEDFAKTSIENAAKVAPKSWHLVDRLTPLGIVRLQTSPRRKDVAI